MLTTKNVPDPVKTGPQWSSIAVVLNCGPGDPLICIFCMSYLYALVNILDSDHQLVKRDLFKTVCHIRDTYRIGRVVLVNQIS